jgi:hypothetical protein
VETLKRKQELFCEELKGVNDGRCHFFNTNAASPEVMDEYLPKIKEITGGKPLKLLLTLHRLWNHHKLFR